jgi:hypothetical protein
MSLTFDNEGVHLTSESVHKFVIALLFNAKSLFTAKVINLDIVTNAGNQGNGKATGKPENQVEKQRGGGGLL